MSNFYNQASWVLVPSGIEEDIVFAQKPISGLGDLTFTRASDATYTDSTGVVRRSPYNLFTFSEQFDNAAWSKLGSSTIVANAAIAPNGTLTADSVTGAGSIILYQGLFRAQTYTQSCYAKAGTGNVFGIYFGASHRALFNLTNGTVTLQTGGTASIQSVGDGWYRCVLTATTTADQYVGPSFTPNGTVFIWGAQLVEGSSALDYFPTTNRQDVPRIDFRNADGTLSSCGRLLLEPQRTNLVPNGLAYQAATGVAYNTAVSGSPMAGVNCARITKNEAAGTLRYANQQCSSSVLAGSTGYVLSAFFKYDGVDVSTTMEFNNSADFGGTAWRQFINIASTGITLGTSTSCTSTIENWGSGWYRVNVRITTGAAPSGSLITYLMRLPSTLSTGQGFLHALPQFELGAYQTTYIPTTTAAVTRLADAASKTGVSSLIGQTEGTLFFDVNLDTRQSFTYFAIAPNLASATIYIGIGITGNVIQAEVNNSGVQAAIVTSNSATGRFKIAFAYKQNDFAFYVNGSLIGTDTSGTVPACSEIGLYNYNQTQPLKYNQAALFPTRLTNAQLAQLTTL